MSAKRAILALSRQTSAKDANAERDMRDIFDELGYSLPIPITRTQHLCEGKDDIFTFHVTPEDWVKYLMEHQPQLLGGHSGDAFDNFAHFWKVFEVSHPTHRVFQSHSERLRHVIPLLLHGDEGRAVKRTNYFLTSIESPMGSVKDPNLRCCCCSMLEGRPGLPEYGSDRASLDPDVLTAARAMVSNFKGHSYLSRFLLFGCGGWIYKSRPEVIDKLLHEIGLSFKRLFETGITLSCGTTVYASLVFIKGDMDYHKKTANLTRSYANLGKVNNIEICHHCKAGGDAYPFEDYSENPKWLESLYTSRPWNVDPYLCLIPYDLEAPEKALHGDIMHIYKLGIGRDIVGGVLIILLRKGFFDEEGQSIDIRQRFDRAHGHFKLWCGATGKNAGLRSFTKAFFNLQTLTSAPWSNSKASDTVTLIEWLAFFLKTNIEVPSVMGFETLLQQMLQLCEAALNLRMIHHHPLFLERRCARWLYINLMTLLRAYASLARKSIELEIRSFLQNLRRTPCTISHTNSRPNSFQELL